MISTQPRISEFLADYRKTLIANGRLAALHELHQRTGYDCPADDYLQCAIVDLTRCGLLQKPETANLLSCAYAYQQAGIVIFKHPHEEGDEEVQPEDGRFLDSYLYGAWICFHACRHTPVWDDDVTAMFMEFTRYLHFQKLEGDAITYLDLTYPEGLEHFASLMRQNYQSFEACYTDLFDALARHGQCQAAITLGEGFYEEFRDAAPLAFALLLADDRERLFSLLPELAEDEDHEMVHIIIERLLQKP